MGLTFADETRRVERVNSYHDVISLKTVIILNSLVANQDVVAVKRWLHRLSCNYLCFIHCRTVKAHPLTLTYYEVAEILKNTMDGTASSNHHADPRRHFREEHFNL